MTKLMTTHDELIGFLVEHYHEPDEYRPLLTRVEQRGDGLAIYRNSDLGHSGIGQIMVGSYGSSEALFEVELHTELPAIMPDGVTNPDGGTVNWRYTLVAVYLKEAERS